MTDHASPVSHSPSLDKPGWVKRMLHGVCKITFAPFRAFMAVRRAMTPASVSALLFGIVTLNIIWGFPWTGLFSACVGMFTAGCLIHFLTRPSLDTSFSLPNSAAREQPFQVTIHAKNQSLLPALDFGLAFAKPILPKKRWINRKPQSPVSYSVKQSVQQHLFLSPGDSAALDVNLTYHRRGIHTLPDTIVSGSFPFHLFESQVAIPSVATIAITPTPLTGDDDHAKGLLNNLGGWSHKLLSGDQLDYTGSREYEPGMPVRRWDFPSWARLGVPIVREFQSPSVPQVFLIIDTALSEHAERDSNGEYPAFEQMLSLTTTAIHDLAKQTVKIQFFLTDSGNQLEESSGIYLTDTDAESMLIQLAAAAPVDAAQANHQISTAMELAGRSPVLLLTTRNLPEIKPTGYQNCTVIRTDRPRQQPRPPRSHQPKSQPQTV